MNYSESNTLYSFLRSQHFFFLELNILALFSTISADQARSASKGHGVELHANHKTCWRLAWEHWAHRTAGPGLLQSAQLLWNGLKHPVRTHIEINGILQKKKNPTLFSSFFARPRPCTFMGSMRNIISWTQYCLQDN